MDVITLLIAVTCSLHMFPCPSLRLVNLSKHLGNKHKDLISTVGFFRTIANTLLIVLGDSRKANSKATHHLSEDMPQAFFKKTLKSKLVNNLRLEPINPVIKL